MNDFVEDASKHIFVTHGDGGTGKTWLSNLVARKLQMAKGAACQALLVDDVTSVEMLRTIAWNLMMPALPMPTGNVDLVAFGEQWLDGAARVQLAQDYRGAFRELFDINGSADSVEGGADIGSLALALSILLIYSPVPQVLIFRDCHRASVGLARVIKQLLLSLANLGWGQTRIILEYRDGTEASSCWRGFLESELPALADAVVDAQLSAVGCDDIEQALTAVTVDPHCGPLAIAIFEKTGGNPLLIHHLLLHFAEKGYVAPVDDHATKLRVVSFGDIDHELADDIGLPGDVLPVRIKYLIDALPEERREPVLQYLTGAAFSGLLYEESLFSAVFSNGIESLEPIRHWLMDSEIVELALDEDRPQFIHDFMRLAVRTVLTRRDDFRLHGESVLNILPSDKVLAQVIAGDLLTALGRPYEGFQRFDAGHELAKLQGLLLQNERCLTGARDALEAISIENTPLLERRAAIGLELASTLTQTGSQIRALDTLTRVRRLLESKRASFLLPGPERSMLAAGVIRQQLILLVRLMRGEEFFDHFGDCASYKLASEDVHLALTRYTLMAIHCSQVGAAWKAFPYMMATCPADGDWPSSLQSDMGRLYLQSDPLTALEHWEQGLLHAKGRRQVSHSRLNLLVAALYLGGEVPALHVLDALEDELRTQGVANQLYRLWNCRGILAAREGRVSLASEYFERALSRSQSTDQPYWQWKSHNNMAVCMAYHGKHQDAENHLLTALSLTASLTAASTRTTQEIVQPLMRVATEHQLGIRTDLLRKQTPPVSCGLLPILHRNLSILRSTDGGATLTETVASPEDWCFPAVDQCPLWLDAREKMLAFAIE
jgi:tetratricopeptide (TPR) repeat protein